MKAPSEIKIGFDPTNADPEIRQVFNNRTAMILWCCIKNTHLTDQHFPRLCLEVASSVDNISYPENIKYSSFMRYASPLNSKFGRVTVYEHGPNSQSAVDNEFWGGIFMIIKGQRNLRLISDIRDSAPETKVKAKAEPVNEDRSIGHPEPVNSGIGHLNSDPETVSDEQPETPTSDKPPVEQIDVLPVSQADDGADDVTPSESAIYD